MNSWGALLLMIGGLIVINELSKQRWCGTNCQIIMNDARGTLVQDLVSGALYWL